MAVEAYTEAVESLRGGFPVGLFLFSLLKKSFQKFEFFWGVGD